MEVDDVLEATTQTHHGAQSAERRRIFSAIPQNVVGYSDDTVCAMNRALKEFPVREYVSAFRVVRMQERAQHFIEQIFASYIEDPRQLPTEYQAED